MTDKLLLAHALSNVRVGVQMAGTLVDSDGTARIELLERLDEGWRNITIDEFATTPDVADRFDDLVVTRDVPPTVDADILPGLGWFTSSHGVAVSWVDPVTDRGPALIADGIVLPPNTAAALREFFLERHPWPSERDQLAEWMRFDGTRPAVSNEIARIVSRVYEAWHGKDAWTPFSLRYAIAHEIQRAGLTADDARRSAVRRRFDLAAHALAAGVDVADRLATDPEYVADRSAWAQEQREQMRVADLQRYRDAEAALDATEGNPS
ncbi:hypothetical protein [Microbacterium arborescens]